MSRADPHPAGSSLSSRLPAWLAALLCFLVSLAIYGSALDNALVLDDVWVLEQHPDVLEPEGITRLWTHHYWEGLDVSDRNLYRPLTILSFHLDALRGREPADFRLPNVLLLGLLGTLLFGWLRAWNVTRAVSLTAALIVIAHPLQASVINYIVGRADLLVLVGVLGFLLVQRRSGSEGWNRPRTLAAILFALIALGSKESGVCVVPLAWVQEWCIRRRSGWRVVGSTSSLLAGVPACVYLLARFSVVGMGHGYDLEYAIDPSQNPLVGMPLLERLPAGLAISWFYGRQLLLPDPSFWHVPDQLPTMGDVEPWLGALLGCCVVLVLIRSLRKRSPLALPAAIWLVQLAIVSQVLGALAFYAANRQAGPFLVAFVAGIAFGAQRWKHLWWARVGVPAVGLLALIPMVAQVRWVNSMWTSSDRMAEIDLVRHPLEIDTLYANAAANLWVDRNQEAAHFAEQLLELRPDVLGAWLNLGLARLALGEPARAESAFREVVKLTREDPAGMQHRGHALGNLGALALQHEDLDAAENYLREAERALPEDSIIIKNLAFLAEKRGDVPEMARRCIQLLQGNPEDWPEFAEVVENIIRRLGRLERASTGQEAAECRRLIERLRTLP